MGGGGQFPNFKDLSTAQDRVTSEAGVCVCGGGGGGGVEFSVGLRPQRPYRLRDG